MRGPILNSTPLPGPTIHQPRPTRTQHPPPAPAREARLHFLARVQLVDAFPEVLHYAGAPHLHRSGQFSVFDAEIASQHAVFADLLKRRQLLRSEEHTSELQPP